MWPVVLEHQLSFLVCELSIKNSVFGGVIKFIYIQDLTSWLLIWFLYNLFHQFQHLLNLHYTIGYSHKQIEIKKKN